MEEMETAANASVDAMELFAQGTATPALFALGESEREVSQLKQILGKTPMSSVIHVIRAHIVRELTGAKTVEAVAQHVAAKIRHHCASGPYAIATMSDDMSVAWAVAALFLGENVNIRLINFSEQSSAGSARTDIQALRSTAPLPVGIDHISLTCEESPSLQLVQDGQLGSTLRQTVENDCRDIHEAARSRLRIILDELHASGPAYNGAPSTLIPLRVGNPESSVIFCVPGAGASVIDFLDFAESANVCSSIFGLQPRGLDGGTPPYTSVEKAADALIELVMRKPCEVPIHLVGHSFGGWVAFEVAMRLQANGRQVATLNIIDSDPPAMRQEVPDIEDLEIVREWVGVIEQSVQRSLGIDADKLSVLTQDQRMRLVTQRLIELGVLSQRSTTDVLRGAFRMFAACLRTCYVPAGIYAGNVRVVNFQHASPHGEDDEKRAELNVRGWSAFATNITAFRAKGNHITGLKAPHARGLADNLAL